MGDHPVDLQPLDSAEDADQHRQSSKGKGYSLLHAHVSFAAWYKLFVRLVEERPGYDTRESSNFAFLLPE
jgi:hypothetical protein